MIDLIESWMFYFTWNCFGQIQVLQNKPQYTWVKVFIQMDILHKKTQNTKEMDYHKNKFIVVKTQKLQNNRDTVKHIGKQWEEMCHGSHFQKK